MKVTVAIDSLKGSLSSLEAGEAIKKGILRVYEDAEVAVRPLADGGEGTTEALTLGMGGELRSIRVTGPAGEQQEASYGIIRESGTAILEMAAAAGITQVEGEKKNPLYTTTYGVGEMIKDAVKQGCRRFIVGIGGSATNDGGIGMLQALGFGLNNAEGRPVSFGAIGLSELKSIDTDAVLPELSECQFKIACDVTNPLCGPQGCSAVFGPQKGATEEMIRDMDGWLGAYSELVMKSFPNANPETPGTGAAGGLGFAFLSFMNAELRPGIKIVLEETGLEEYISGSDIVVTGEGRLDSQTVMGKAPSGVAEIAGKYGLPVLAFSGAVTRDAVACNAGGIAAFFPILRTVCTLEEAMDKDNAAENMADSVEQAFRLIRVFRK